MKKLILGLLIFLGHNSVAVAQMALSTQQLKDTISDQKLMSPSCDSVANFSVTSPTSCKLVINASGPIASLTTDFQYLITVYQNGQFVADYTEYTLPFTIPQTLDGGLYKVTCQAYCCEELVNNSCYIFPINYLVAPLQKRWIEVKPPILGTITALNQPLGVAFQFNSFKLNWTYNNVPAPSSCTFDYKRFIVEIRDNGVLVKTEIISTNYNTVSEVFDSLQPCKTYQVKITPQEGVLDNLDNIRWYSGTPIIKNDVQTNCCNGVSQVALHGGSASSISVKWQSSANATAQKYRIDVFLNSSIVQTFYQQVTSTQQQTLYQFIPNLIQGTTYLVSVTSMCSCGTSSGCFVTGTTGQVSVTMPGDPCSTPATLTVAEKTTNRIKVSWNHVAYSGTKRYVLKLKDQFGILLQDTIINAPQAAATITMSYYGLVPATNYVISINAQCCANSECEQTVSGAITTISVKTNLNIAPECSSKPTTFSYSGIDMTSVKLNWSGLNTTPLSNTGRRFIVVVPNGPSFVVSSGTQTTIGSLQPNTTYQIKIREVFDGNGNVYSSGCNEVLTTVKTLGLASLGMTNK